MAKNACAPPELLAEITDGDPKAPRKNVMGNPATPYETLMKFASQYPEQLLDNPVFDLLFLEHPNLLDDIPESGLRSMLRREVCPESFLRWAAKSDDEGSLLALAMNGETPQDVLKGLKEHSNEKVAKAVGLHVNLAGELSGDWEEVFQEAVILEDQSDTMEARHVALVFCGCVPDWAVHQWVLPLVGNKDEDVRSSAAENPNTPVTILEKLAEDEDVRAGNQVLSGEENRRRISCCLKTTSIESKPLPYSER